MTEEEELDLEITLVKQRCLDDLLYFTRYFFKKMHKVDFIVNEHHVKICDALTKVHNGEIQRLMINISPRFSKTELGVKNFIAWSLAKNPQCEYIHTSYSDELATDNSEGTKDIILCEAYQKMFPDVKLKKDSSGKKKWKTTEGGVMFSVSAGGSMTGFGAGKTGNTKENFKFSGMFSYDDPIKPEDANNELARNKINGRYYSTMRSRLNSRQTPVIITMQRLHENDLCGYILSKEREKWTVVSLPAIKEDGTALWEFKLNLEDLRELQIADENIYQTQYLQEPISADGNYLQRADFEIIKKSDVPFDMDSVMQEVYIDGAYSTTKKSDPTAVMRCYYNKVDGFLYILECFSKKLELYEFLKFFRGWARDSGIQRRNPIRIEPKSSGDALISMLRKPEFGGFSCRKIKGAILRKNKDQKVADIRGIVESGKIKIVEGAWNDRFINECVAFPRGTHDDMLDDLCFAVHKHYIKSRKKKGVHYKS